MAFAILWCFPFFFFSFFLILIFKNYYFSTFIPLFAFPTVLFPYSYSLMYINLLYLSLSNLAYLFFLSFLSSFKIFVTFIFTALFPNWHLALVLFSSLCSNQFCSGRYNFWFPLFLCQVNLLYFIFVGLF